MTTYIAIYLMFGFSVMFIRWLMKPSQPKVKTDLAVTQGINVTDESGDFNGIDLGDIDLTQYRNIAPALTGKDVVIHYQNKNREVSVRKVTIKKIYSNNYTTYLYGFCHEAQGNRQFRVERIINVVDADTGELLPAGVLSPLKRDQKHTHRNAR